MLMSYVLDAGKNRHNMDTLSEIHLGHKTISFKDLVGQEKKKLILVKLILKKPKIMQQKMLILLLDYTKNL